MSDLPFDYGVEPRAPLARPPKVRRHKHQWCSGCVEVGVASHCTVSGCGIFQDDPRIKRGRANRSRGNREELTVARAIGGRKVGPLGHPWDVEMPGYSRLQVKKLKNPPSLRAIGESLTFGTGDMMAGFIWVEPGRGGEQLIVFRLKDFASRHGVHIEEEVDE